MTDSEVFIEQLDRTLKELLILGYSIVEDTYLQEINSLAQGASSLGFDGLHVLIKRLYDSCQDYALLNSAEHALQITKSIALVQFAIASLNLRVDRSNHQQLHLEQLFTADSLEQD